MIVEKVGTTSSADYANARATCTKMKEASKNPRVLYSLCLSPLVKKPLRVLAHMEFLETCVEHENVVTFFIRGILSFFIENDPDNGISYLELGAIGEGAGLIKEAAYLNGVLCLLHGDLVEGEEVMDLMKWWDGMKTADEVWSNFNAWHHCLEEAGVRPIVAEHEAPESCHLRDLETACPDCFHYKRALKFFHVY